MAYGGRSGGLQTIFSFFLGLMVTAFVGVGVYTFHPPPDKEFEGRVRNLNRQEQAVRASRATSELTDAERDEIRDLIDERNDLADASQKAREPWGRVTSVVLIGLATLAMALSLVGADRLPVIGNGLLLGGVFTMIYGVGWIIATDTSITRFVVITVALAITLGLGYVRFVHLAIPATAAKPGTAADGLADIERRVRDLEGRMTAAANALGSGGDATDVDQRR
jgi:hypothetical protein